RLLLYLVGAFSAIGVFLAGIGLYGSMSFFVAQRTREIGIRIALGAEPGSVRRLVINQAMTLTAAGLAIGLTMSVAGERFIRSFLFGVTTANPLVLITVALIIAAITASASYVPVRRALCTDPIVVLRQD